MCYIIPQKVKIRVGVGVSVKVTVRLIVVKIKFRVEFSCFSNIPFLTLSVSNQATLKYRKSGL